MKLSHVIIGAMGAAMAGGAAREAREAQVTKATFKPNYLNLPKHPKSTGSHHAKSSHKQNRRKEIAQRSA